MNTKKIADLPIPQSGCGDTRLTSDGLVLTLEFEYRKEGKDYIGIIYFNNIVAYRFRSELHSDGFVPESYESIAEVEKSNWAASIFNNAKHYAIFLSSNGYFEVLASKFVLGEPSEGLLSKR
ncbi:MAG: hypothetical protein LBK71_12530 [Verrucomicrobiales bacterium]|jgi:hypothetical protein|nr:hypothetical protein [Verrucomicrobiales bacterium]